MEHIEHEELKENQETEFDVGGVPVKIVEVGSSGTEIFSGYIFEEYLQELQGRTAADIYDRMRRSDPKVKMILSAMKNPIKGASWEINENGDETKEGQIQKAFIEHILFDGGIGKTWKSFLHEALSCIDFGYSLFEITYSAILNHEVFGSYNGVKSLAFRSQRTIEQWNITRGGELESVYQEANGDKQENVTIGAEYLLHFALEREGDNYEGISILRPAYGPWLRKNNFLKMIAAGIEKYAIPVPILEIPEGKQSSPEYKKALNAMKRYVSHQCNYLTVPFGWKITLNNNPFDASKIREVINDENIEIVNAALANFLELGQSGSGSYALSMDLSDFFLGGLEYVAEQIAETINQKLIPTLIRLNFPGQEQLVELSAKGISDRAGKELADIVKMLVEVGVLTADDRLEESLRRRFGLTERDETTSRKLPTSSETPPPIPGPKQFAENQDEQKKKSSDPVKGLIEENAESLRAIMSRNLKTIGVDIAKQAANHWNKSDETQRVAPLKEYNLNTDQYKNELREELARQYNTSVEQVREQNSFYKNIKLSETAIRIKFAETDKLNKRTSTRINGIVDSLVGLNTDEIIKTTDLNYTQAVEKFQDVESFESNLVEKIEKKIDGPMTSAGSLVNASTMVNTARKDFFKEIMKEGEVESFTWINPDPITDICKGLNGVTMKSDDPNVDLYWPPLHFNCKTYTVANTSKTKNNPEPGTFTPTKTQNESINLAEARPGNCPDGC